MPSERRKAVFVDVLAAQPEESWKLFRVALSTQGADVFRGRGREP